MVQGGTGECHLLASVLAIVLLTYKLQTNLEREVMANTLRLWTMARLTSNIEWICGGDVVGSVVDDQSSPYRNTVPVPPMTCAQVEVISYSSLLHPLRRKILKELKNMLLSNPRGNWLTIYLTLFIILHSCSHVTRRDEAFGRDIGQSVSLSKRDM